MKGPVSELTAEQVAELQAAWASGETPPSEMVLHRDQHPTEGEWKRAKVDRNVLEQAAKEHAPEPGTQQFNITFPLRTERVLAVPAGAVGVAFFFNTGEGDALN